MFNFFRKSHPGFTLIEILVTISIISLLSSVVIGGLNEAREKAKMAVREEAMRQMKIALQSYYLDHGEYPDGNYNSDDWNVLSDQLVGGGYATALPEDESDYTYYYEGVPCDPPGQGTCSYTLNGLGTEPTEDPPDEDPPPDEDFPPPTDITVDLMVDGGQGPVTLESGDQLVLSWTSTLATSCVASDAWSGTKDINNTTGETIDTADLSPGNYTFTITCTDGVGSVPDSVVVTVNEPSGPQEVVRCEDKPSDSSLIDVYRSCGLAPFTVLFNGLDLPGGNNIYRYEWDFKDSNSDYSRYDEGRLVGHRFDEPGKYRVSVITYDQNGSTQSHDIEIWAASRPTGVNAAKTYYISDNDYIADNDGLTPQKPWNFATLKANGSAIPHGSQVLFKGGETFDLPDPNTANNWNLHNSGLVRAHPYYITIGSYGSGKATLANYIDTQNSPLGAGLVMDNIVLASGAVFMGSNGMQQPGIQVHLRDVDVSGNIQTYRLHGSTFEDLYIDGQGSATVAFGTNGDRVGDIENINNSPDFTYLKDSVLTNSYRQCLYFAGSGKNYLIEDNVFYNCAVSSTVSDNRPAFVTHGWQDNIILRNNTFRDNFAAGFTINSALNNVQPFTNELLRNIIVEGNRFYNNGLYVGIFSSVQDTIFRNNLVYNNTPNINGGDLITVKTPTVGTPDADTVNFQAYNNTFFNNRGRTFSINANNVQSVTIKNNIMIAEPTTNGSTYIKDDRVGGILNVSNNVYGGNVSSSDFRINGAGISIDTWVVDYEPSAINVKGQPSPINSSGVPVAGSPAINAGTNVNAQKSYNGLTRPLGSFDIGAYEVSGSSSFDNSENKLAVATNNRAHVPLNQFSLAYEGVRLFFLTISAYLGDFIENVERGWMMSFESD